MRTYTLAWLVIGAVSLAAFGCGDEQASDLLVDVRTDVRPGHEFASVRIDLVGAEAAGPSRIEIPATADQEMAYIEGLRVAEFEDISRSQASVRVTLFDSNGVTVVDRTAAVRLGNSTRVVTVVLTRDCRGVVCPGAGDAASQVACLGGRCVDPRCTPETPEYCPAGCAEDSECSVVASCVTGRCEGGTCLRVERDDGCGDLEWCHPEEGCRPLDAGRDGGTLDAAPPLDGRTPDAGSAPRALYVAAGLGFTCALTDEGRVLCWGSNEHGQLGDGTMTDRPTPDYVDGISDGVELTNGGSHVCVRHGGGSVSCWGRGSSGQLGNGFNADRATPTPVTLVDDATDISAGWGHACVVRASGELWCWGANDSGALGDGTTTRRLSPVMAVGLDPVESVAAGQQYTCVVLTDGTVSCWGSNSAGQLGDGTGTANPIPTTVSGVSDAVMASVRIWHSCALVDSGNVQCWGQNGSGELGNGTSSGGPTDVVSVVGITDAVEVSVGRSYTCARRATGEVWCWGDGSMGQLGDGTDAARAVPGPVSGITGAVSIATGRYHACAADDEGAVWCWGDNSSGQLGDGTTDHSPTPVQAILPSM